MVSYKVHDLELTNTPQLTQLKELAPLNHINFGSNMFDAPMGRTRAVRWLVYLSSCQTQIYYIIKLYVCFVCWRRDVCCCYFFLFECSACQASFLPKSFVFRTQLASCGLFRFVPLVVNTLNVVVIVFVAAAFVVAGVPVIVFVVVVLLTRFQLLVLRLLAPPPLPR